MFAQVIGLRYWKSEHDETTCEDAYNANCAEGLFAIADGAGTTLFSDTWARILVASFLRVPLLSTDPFEVEWWLRLAQEQYKQEAPDIEGMTWNALQKARGQGSHSTLATLRFTQVQENTAQATLLAFGDSCILVYKAADDQLLSFPLEQPRDFLQAPICLPSKLSEFYRHFHRAWSRQITLEAGDVVLLATDAVARWIIGAGDALLQMYAFQEVIVQTPESWPAFIQDCRASSDMADDDSTALVLSLHPSHFPGGLALGTTTRHSKELLVSRKHSCEQALAERNSELVAVYYGDGDDIQQAGVKLPQDQIQHARQVADALREVLQVLRQSINTPDVVSRVEPVWQKYAELLTPEPCAANLLHTLTSLAIVQPSSLPIENAIEESVIPGTPPAQQEPSVAPLEQQTQMEEAPPAVSVALSECQDRCLEMEIELQLLKALRSEDDAAIVVASAAFEHFSEHFSHNIDLSARDKERIELARQRHMLREQLPAVQASRRIEQMAALYEQVLAIPMPVLTQHESAPLALAHQFAQACRSDADAEILAAFSALDASSYRDLFDYTEQEMQRVQEARSRQAAPTQQRRFFRRRTPSSSGRSEGTSHA